MPNLPSIAPQITSYNFLPVLSTRVPSYRLDVCWKPKKEKLIEVKTYWRILFNNREDV